MMNGSENVKFDCLVMKHYKHSSITFIKPLNRMVFVTSCVNIEEVISEFNWQIQKRKNVHASTHQQRFDLVNSFLSLYVEGKQRMICDVNF